MKDCFITFRSVTPAQRGEGILRRAGVECSLQRTPRWMEEQGCGYSLRVQVADWQRAGLLLKNAGVNYRKVYLKLENGSFEELSL